MVQVCFALLLLMPADGPTPDEEFRALRDAHQAAFDDFVSLSNLAKTPEDEAKVLEHPGRKTPSYSQGFMDLARKYPGTPAAEDALLWVGTHIFYRPDSEEARTRLVRDHVTSPKLGRVLGFQGHYDGGMPDSDRFFREILAKNPHREIQGLATYWLARVLNKQADISREARKATFQKPSYFTETYGEDWDERLRKLDPEALDREADALFERVAKFYADIPHNDKRRTPGTLGEAAAGYLREARELSIGKTPPDFEGTDLDGRAFRLADLRGKVVVLDFGSHFYCGTCRETYPQLRAMTRRLEGHKFALISINAEPDKVVGDLKTAWKAEGNTWPCLFDGSWEGPIQKAWNIQSFPTIYVLDAQGVIRHKELRGKDLDDAVDRLVEELEIPGATHP
jgi:peroxiredoxin